jgi:hypothetical protein
MYKPERKKQIIQNITYVIEANSRAVFYNGLMDHPRKMTMILLD